MATGDDDRRKTKVERDIDEYGLAGIESTLVRRWTADRDERWSLRDLADFFNERLLEAALRQAGEQPLDGEVENYYRLLTTDDVSAGTRTEARRQLEQAGIEVDELQSDFVSHQAIHTYLTTRQEVSYEPSTEAERIESARTTLRRLESRAESVTENTLAGLRDAEVLDLENFSVLSSVSVVCEDCGTQYDVESVLEQGGCDCQRGD